MWLSLWLSLSLWRHVDLEVELELEGDVDATVVPGGRGSCTQVVDEVVDEVDVGADKVVDKAVAVLSMVLVLRDIYRMPSGRLHRHGICSHLLPKLLCGRAQRAAFGF